MIRRPRALTLAMAALMLLSIPICATSTTLADTSGRDTIDPWMVATVALERQAIYDMAVGEVDSLSPGLEIIVTGGGGIVSQYAADTFEQSTLFVALKTQHAVAIGDVVGSKAGNEVVTVGTDRKVHVIQRNDDGSWKGVTVWQSIGSLNGVAIGEFNGTHPGLEIAVVGDEAMLVVLNEDPAADGGWSVTAMQVQEIPITNMMTLAADILPDSPGDEILIGSFSGHAFLARHDASGQDWNITAILRDDFAILGFGHGPDLVQNITGPEIFVAGFSGKVMMVYFNGTNWTKEDIYQDPDPIYTVVPADVDPRYPGAELVACGIGNDVHILRLDNGTWLKETIRAKSPDLLKLLYDVEVAEIDSAHKGLEIMIGGMNQDLIEVTYVEPGFELVPLHSTHTTISGHDAEFWIKVEAQGNFEGEVTLTTERGTLTPTVAAPGELVHVKVPTTPGGTAGSFKFNVTGSAQGMEKVVELTMVTESGSTPGLDLELHPQVQTTVPGFSTTYLAKVTILNDWYPLVEYSIDTPIGIDAEIGHNMAEPNRPATITVTPSALSGSGTYYLDIRCTGIDTQGGVQRTFTELVVATLHVDASGSPDFTMSVKPNTIVGASYSTVNFELQLNPLFDLEESVVLSVDGVPSNMTGAFSANVVKLPATVTYSLELDLVDDYYEIHFLTFTATSGDIEHKASTSIFQVLPDPTFDFHLEVLPSVQATRPGATAYYILYNLFFKPVDELKVVFDDPHLTGTIASPMMTSPGYTLLTVDVARDAVPGNYTGKVIGTAEWERNATFNLVVDGSQYIQMELVQEVIVSSPGVPGTFEIDLTGAGNGEYREVDIDIYGVIANYPPEKLYNSYHQGSSDPFTDPLTIIEVEPRGVRPKGTHMVVLAVQFEGKTLPTTLVGTIHMTGPMPYLDMCRPEIKGSYREGSKMTFTIDVMNHGQEPARNVLVELLVDGKKVGQRTIPDIPRDGTAKVTIPWTAVGGDHNVTAILVYDENEGETRFGDTVVETEITIYPNRMEGPAISILLLLMMVALSMVMKARMAKDDRSSSSGPKRNGKDEEE